ncbi:hypothetical protein M422DRAFT_205327 [Sphaerobolus stellatus SS14]|nr:hypothetical protein M422DRAFT_205327 [Sphaerobolus stellatus SS14]
MATFAKQAFNAASYAAVRPTYPRALFDFIYQYHGGGSAARWERAVDLGCGTGQATTELTGFREVIGMDPSESMIKKANQNLQALSTTTSVRFVKSEAEDLQLLEPESVDLVVAAQAAHWFDYTKLWPQLARILRRNGSVAFWGYSQMRISGHPYLTPLIEAYSTGSDALNSVGPYWEQPGRKIVDNHFLDIPKAPEEYFKEHQHIFWTGNYYPSLPSAKPILLRKRTTWDGLQAYLRTFSSWYTFKENNPEDFEQFTGLSQRPSLGKRGDVVERFWWTLKERVAEENDGDEGQEIEIEWPLAMILFKKS